MQLGSLFKVILKTFFIIKSISTPIIFVGVGKVSFFSCWQIEYTWFMDLNMEKKKQNTTIHLEPVWKYYAILQAVNKKVA